MRGSTPDRSAVHARVGQREGLHPGRVCHRRRKGLTTADLPDHGYWEQWFPADWISESREQIRLWFYSMSFMSVTLIGRSPYRRGPLRARP